MEMMEDSNIDILDAEVNSSYGNASVWWGVTTPHPLIIVTSGSSSVITNVSVSVGGGGVFESDLIIPLYVVIFVLAIVGNSLVLITLAQNKRMRTVTNVYLLNLAVSDLLLGVFCMPFTLVGQVLRNFVFGAAMCKLIPYFQAVSVSVGVWTLVAISLERYFAICRPLKSRRWQTQFHAYKMIAVVWLASLTWNSPILFVSRLQAMKEKGRHKCREMWPSKNSERAYSLFLDAILLLVPLIIMTLAYSLIVSKLWKGLRREIRHNSSCRRQLERTSSSATVNEVVMTTNNINGNSTTGNAVITPLRQHRLFVTNPKQQQQQQLLTRQTAAPSTKCSSRDGNHRTATSVKLWLIKGMVQVRLPASSSNSSSLYRERPATLTTSKSVTIAPLPTGTSAGTYSPSPETSRLIGPGTGEGGTEKDLGVAGGSVDGEDVIIPPGDSPNTYTFTRHAIRSNYMDKSIEAKKKVIRMLFVVVAEFFVCWAPLHVLNTWYIFNPDTMYRYFGSTGVSLVQLLAYISSCCNPITYCFMNRKFRQAFLGVFDCYRCWSLYCCCCCGDVVARRSGGLGGLQRDGATLGGLGGNNSDVSGNDSTVFVGRASTGVRSAIAELPSGTLKEANVFVPTTRLLA